MFAKEIKRFIEIVDKGSLNLAAKYLNISQPAISNSVKILEKNIILGYLNEIQKA